MKINKDTPDSRQTFALKSETNLRTVKHTQS